MAFSHYTRFTCLLAILIATSFVAKASDCGVRERTNPVWSVNRAGDGPFSYSEDDEDGPSNWGDIPCPGYKLCATGNYQSPINVKSEHTWSPPCRLNLVIKPKSSARMQYRVAANDFSFQCDEPFSGCGHFHYRDVHHEFVQVHLHSPSEYKFDGEGAPMEIHFVHQNSKTGSLAVIGVFIKVGRHNAELAKLFRAARRKESETVNLAKLMERVIKDPRPCTFQGSLTTPPCTEGVKWVLSTTPIYASMKQIRTFRAMLGNKPNNRPVQSEQGRSIRCFLEPPSKDDKRPICTKEHY